MRIEHNKWSRKVTAVFLLCTFLFPIAYNPIHYIFVDHTHSNDKSGSHLDTFHRACKLDDFHLDKTIDLGALGSDFCGSIILNFKLIEKDKIYLSYRNFTFNLRAPPTKLFLQIS